MNIIVPMAGRGSRLRPHTLTVPKPLVPVAGKPIVERLVEDIVRTAHDGVDNICFVTGEFGEDVERELVAVAERGMSEEACESAKVALKALSGEKPQMRTEGDKHV